MKIIQVIDRFFSATLPVSGERVNRRTPVTVENDIADEAIATGQFKLIEELADAPSDEEILAEKEVKAKAEKLAKEKADEKKKLAKEKADEKKKKLADEKLKNETPEDPKAPVSKTKAVLASK